jgi:hypothetical protein
MNEKQTAKKAVKILCDKNIGFHNPTPVERRKLLKAFVQFDFPLSSKAYDAVKTTKKINFSDEKDIIKNFDHITIYEIKSTKQEKIPKDFKGYFFDLTTAELLLAQMLGDKHRFAFVNTMTNNHIELTLSEVFAKAKKIYPKWAITLK